MKGLALGDRLVAQRRGNGNRMAARQVANAPLTPLPELEQMVGRAGLTLNAGQMADLALAWRQVTELLGRIPREWRLADDQAFVFRVPPPGVAAEVVRKAAARKAPTRKAPVAKGATKGVAKGATGKRKAGR